MTFDLLTCVQSREREGAREHGVEEEVSDDSQYDDPGRKVKRLISCDRYSLFEAINVALRWFRLKYYKGVSLP